MRCFGYVTYLFSSFPLHDAPTPLISLLTYAGFTWTAWDRPTQTHLTALLPIYKDIQAMARGNSTSAEIVFTYFSAVTNSHYLSVGCQGCSSGEAYSPVRSEGFAYPAPAAACGGAGGGCVELLTYFSRSTGTNLVVPAGWGPIPGDFALWGGNVMFALPLNYSGPGDTVELELWKGVAVAKGPTDYWTLSSAASRTEALARGYTQVGGGLARLGC